MNLVASMIVRNELGRYLDLALDHLLEFCDEVRVLDDFSDDGSFEYMHDRENVCPMTNPGPTFFEHEGRARQALLEWTLEARPTYILAIDADEFVTDPDAVEDAVEEGGDIYSLALEEVWKLDERGVELRIDGQWRARKVPLLFRVPPGVGRSWRIRDRALACGREPEAVALRWAQAQPSGAAVLHFGWARESERGRRAERYFEHDGGKFHASRHLRSILWPDARVKLARRPWPVGLREIAPELVRRTAR